MFSSIEMNFSSPEERNVKKENNHEFSPFWQMTGTISAASSVLVRCLPETGPRTRRLTDSNPRRLSGASVSPGLWLVLWSPVRPLIGQSHPQRRARPQKSRSHRLGNRRKNLLFHPWLMIIKWVVCLQNNRRKQFTKCRGWLRSS